MGPKSIKLTSTTDAELALEKRYELLRKKKEEKAAKQAPADTAAAKQGGAAAGGIGFRGARGADDVKDVPPAKEPVAVDTGRMLGGGQIFTAVNAEGEVTKAPGYSIQPTRAKGESQLMPKPDNRLPIPMPRALFASAVADSQAGGGAAAAVERASTATPAPASGTLSAFERTKLILAKEAQKKRPSSPVSRAALNDMLPASHNGTGAAAAAGDGEGADGTRTEKDAPMLAREHAAVLLASKSLGGSERHGIARDFPNGIDIESSDITGDGVGGGGTRRKGGALVHKVPVMMRPAVRAAELVFHKRARNNDAWVPLGDSRMVGTVDDYVADGVGERESKEGREVFVGDLPDNCTIEAVASALYRFGHVNIVRVMEARNFGFVTFADRDGAAKAVEACRAACPSGGGNPVVVVGHVITVDYARGALPGWKFGDSFGGEEKSKEHKYIADIRSKAAEEYQKLDGSSGGGGGGGCDSSGGTFGGGRSVARAGVRFGCDSGHKSTRDLVVYDDI
mmetsp:Transcript_28133/g.69266  ORF Transcript_28133/g.69266 Transcript_28133/m.69266 type:complete len:510 (-) Transcript_28133:199-1728(-)|eukprot:CAMPEP_0197589022 /NCGR_PEP_ID=MMETSP1326-20131121/10100_1 /TAXON_ID=1155430 /ORGANISM="Genus nov. species nov., Strain RCC2288" /LENGTH=509 /DNA_ID=CAMNT_0043153915 /DNA_START=160 /DNA_END=1689 /DNA_ORIENTATION=+